MSDERNNDQRSPNLRPWEQGAYAGSHSVGPRHTDPEDLALFAMQLLSGEEAVHIAEHIEHCAECRRELAHIHGDLGAYALTVESHAPSATARQRLLRQVSREKKVAPISNPALAAYGRTNSILGVSSGEEDTTPRRRVLPIVLGWSGWAIAAGLAFACAILYHDRLALRGSVAEQAHQIARVTADATSARRLTEALTDPKAVRVELSSKPLPPKVPIGATTYNPQKGTLVFLASNLDQLQTYKTYELWLIPADGSVSIPAGTFHPDEAGNASLIMPDLPKGIEAKGFGVTIEDEGGSQTPTKPIIMAGF